MRRCGRGNRGRSPGEICELPARHVDRGRRITRDERAGPAEATRGGAPRSAGHRHYRQGQRRTRGGGDRGGGVLVHREAAEGAGVARAAGPRSEQGARCAAARAAAAATARDRKAGGPGGHVEAHAGSDAHRGDGRAELGVRVDHRRNRFGQGNRRADAAPAFAACQWTVCGHQLFRHPRDIDGERDFWPRARRLHGGSRAAHRLLRARRRRNAAAG